MGNATEAAQAAGVKRMTPYKMRRRDEWFAHDWEQALAAAPEKIAAREAGELGWVRRCRRRKTQLATLRSDMWTARDDKAFLRLLAQNGNGRASAKAIGRDPNCAWRRRRLSPAFEEALDDAHVRLEYELVDYANQLIERAQDCADAAASRTGEQAGGEIVTRTDASFALQVVTWLDARKAGERRGNLPAPWPIEEVRASIIRKVEAIKRHRERMREREAGRGRRE